MREARQDWAEKMVATKDFKIGPGKALVLAADAKTLLRRLDRAWRRDVRALQAQHAPGQTRVVEEAEYDHAYNKALDDLLARRKGKEGKHGHV